MRPAGRTDITKLMVAFRNFPNAPTNSSETSISVTFCYGPVPVKLFRIRTRPENFISQIHVCTSKQFYFYLNKTLQNKGGIIDIVFIRVCFKILFIPYNSMRDSGA